MLNSIRIKSCGFAEFKMQPVSVLATDMDGTFIPLEGNEENRHDLQRLCAEIKRCELSLVYVTGRDYTLVLDAVVSHELPKPQWLICDVGTSIYKNAPEGNDSDSRHQILDSYHAHLAEIVGSFEVRKLAELLSDISELRLQEDNKQGPFKLSYYCRASLLGELTTRLSRLIAEKGVPYRIIASVDPFTDEGLIDLLPENVSKDYALCWWIEHTGRDKDSIVFAGDSGNDLAALTAGYRSIVVANADDEVVRAAASAHRSAGWTDRLFIAEKPATSGVLEGLQYFLSSS
jgi:HAD superfamily hydrolase (TIGR01484 family)